MGRRLFSSELKTMRLFIKIVFVLLSVNSIAMADKPTDIEQYAQCVRQTRDILVRYHEAIPTAILAADRKLIRMAEAIQIMMENYNMVSGELSHAPQDPLKRHLVSNALASCEVFKSQFESRARKLAIMLVSLSGFAIFAVLRMVLNFFGPTRPKTPTKKEPEDQPASATSSVF
jgi:hypothetical protein